MSEKNAAPEEYAVADELMDKAGEPTSDQSEKATDESSSAEPETSASLDASSDSAEPKTSSSLLDSIKKSFNRGKPSRTLIILAIVFGFLFSVVLVIGIFSYTIGVQIKNQAQAVTTTGQATYQSFKDQNLPETETQLKTLQAQVSQLKQTYQKLSFYNFIPVARNYYLDGLHGLTAAESGLNAGLKTVQAITPYADVLGFSGEGSFEGGAAENRIKLMLDTLEKVTPILDEITVDLRAAQAELDQINENRYPETFRGMAIRSTIMEGKEALAGANTALSDYRPIIELLPEIAGGQGERKKYLILFQNDNELRPTGGFLTAYSVIFIEDGVVTPEKSDDIYELDKKFNKRIAIPEALGRYLTTEKYWNLRDMNTSPDFKISMDQFFENYKEVRGEPDNIDGIIAVDTQILSGLLAVTGPIEIAGYGAFSAEIDSRCDCPQVVYALSEIITRPTPFLREDRKGILGPLMQAILSKIYASPRVFLGDLFQVGLEGLDGRHLQLYFLNEDHQRAAEAINAAGRLEKDEKAEDFFALVNANLGGAKSNLFITAEMKQIVSAPENGTITKDVEITYKNNRQADNCNLEAGLLCLNSTLRDWTRIYLPEGAKLIKAEGFTQEAKEYEEEGFHVIDGFFILEPEGQAKIKLTYTVPYNDNEIYRVKLWKQGGIDPIKTLMEVTGGQEEVLLNKDTIYEVEF